MGDILLLLLFLATLNERLVEAIAKPIVDALNPYSARTVKATKVRRVALIALSELFGVALAFLFGVDLVAPIGDVFQTGGTVGASGAAALVFSGLIIGAGSGFVHETISFLGKAKVST